MQNTNEKQTPTCPLCHSAGALVQIKKLYFAWLEKDQTFLSALPMRPAELKKLAPWLRPPEIPEQPFWKIIHPDILASIAIFMLVFLNINLFLNENPLRVKILIPSALFIILFLFFRKSILKNFNNQKGKRAESVEKARSLAEDWLHAYICLQDQIIVCDNSASPLHLQPIKQNINLLLDPPQE